jgi:hypothetical protein
VRRASFLLRRGTRVVEDLVALLVQEDMIVAEVRARDVPVKVIRYAYELEDTASTAAARFFSCRRTWPDRHV